MILRAEGVTAGYHVGVPVLHDVSLDLEGPGLVVLVGRGGAGKSLLCAVLAGIHRPMTGTVCWNGTDIYDAPTDPQDLATRVGFLAHVTEPAAEFTEPDWWPPIVIADSLVTPPQTRSVALAALTVARRHALVLFAGHAQAVMRLDPDPDRLFEVTAGQVEEFAP
jgi:ABC-type iron transport system FetAB ATPase subunit